MLTRLRHEYRVSRRERPREQLYRRRRRFLVGLQHPKRLLHIRGDYADLGKNLKHHTRRPNRCAACRARVCSHHLRICVGESSGARLLSPAGSPGAGGDEGAGGGGGGGESCRPLGLSPPQHSVGFGRGIAVCGLKRPWLSLSAATRPGVVAGKLQKREGGPKIISATTPCTLDPCVPSLRKPQRKNSGKIPTCSHTTKSRAAVCGQGGSQLVLIASIRKCVRVFWVRLANRRKTAHVMYYLPCIPKSEP